jgi:hypothetical protein
MLRVDRLTCCKAHYQEQSAKDDLDSHKYLDFTVAQAFLPGNIRFFDITNVCPRQSFAA